MKFNTDKGDITQYLVEQGLSPNHNSLDIKDSGQVVISSLTPDTCRSLSESITGKKLKNRKTIYCQPIALVTPDKPKVDNPYPSAINISSSAKDILPTDFNSADDFTFEPLNLTKSKLLQNSDSDHEEDVDNVDHTEDASEKWLTMNENKRRKKQKRKIQVGSPQLTDFKKQDQETFFVVFFLFVN